MGMATGNARGGFPPVPGQQPVYGNTPNQPRMGLGQAMGGKGGGMSGPRGGMGFNPYGGGMGFNPYGGINRAYDGLYSQQQLAARAAPASPQNFQTNQQQAPMTQQNQQIPFIPGVTGDYGLAAPSAPPGQQQIPRSVFESYSVPAAPRAPLTQQGQQMQFSQGMQGAFADFLRAQQSGSKPGNNSAASNLGQQPSPLAGLASLGGIYGGMK